MWPPQLGLVLRVAKREYQPEQGEELASLLLSPEFMDTPLYVRVGGAFVARLLEHHVGSREARRLSVSPIAPPGLVSLMPDYHRPRGPGFYSIEIKVPLFTRQTDTPFTPYALLAQVFLLSIRARCRAVLHPAAAPFPVQVLQSQLHACRARGR